MDGSNYYESFKHLNAKIIKPAVAEVNRNSDIEITPEFKKKGRAVADIRFLIKENPQLAMFQIGDDEGIRNLDVYKKLIDQGVSDRLARQWISEHGEDYVAQKLDYVRRQPDVKSAAGYLNAALKDDFSMKEVKVKPPSPEAMQRAQERLDQERKADAELDMRLAERARRARKFEIVSNLVSRRNPTQRDADKRLFLAGLEDDLERMEFRTHGWQSALNANAIFAFWAEMNPGAFDELEDS